MCCSCFCGFCVFFGFCSFCSCCGFYGVWLLWLLWLFWLLVSSPFGVVLVRWLLRFLGCCVCGINTFSTSVLTCPFPSSKKQYFRTLFPSSKNSISKLFLKIVDLFCPISTWCLLPTCGINTFSTSVLTCPFPSSKNSISGHYFQVLKTVFPSYFWK